jgi:hypothetical protein
MKKRNKPILLATLLVVFVAAAVGMNVLQNPPKPSADAHADHAETPAQEPEKQVLGAPRSSERVATAASSTADKMKVGKPAATRGGQQPPGPPKQGLLKPSPGVYKPKPSESQTSGQWYTESHMGDKQAGSK